MDWVGNKHPVIKVVNRFNEIRKMGKNALKICGKLYFSMYLVILNVFRLLKEQ